jgi:hypothetical protein
MNGRTTLPTALESKSAFVEVGRLLCLVYVEEGLSNLDQNFWVLVILTPIYGWLQRLSNCWLLLYIERQNNTPYRH